MAGALALPKGRRRVVDTVVVGDVVGDTGGDRAGELDPHVGKRGEEVADRRDHLPGGRLADVEPDEHVGPRLADARTTGQRFRDHPPEPERLVVLGATVAVRPVRLVVPRDGRRVVDEDGAVVEGAVGELPVVASVLVAAGVEPGDVVPERPVAGHHGRDDEAVAAVVGVEEVTAAPVAVDEPRRVAPSRRRGAPTGQPLDRGLGGPAGEVDVTAPADDQGVGGDGRPRRETGDGGRRRHRVGVQEDEDVGVDRRDGEVARRPRAASPVVLAPDRRAQGVSRRWDAAQGVSSRRRPRPLRSAPGPSAPARRTSAAASRAARSRARRRPPVRRRRPRRGQRRGPSGCAGPRTDRRARSCGSRRGSCADPPVEGVVGSGDGREAEEGRHRRRPSGRCRVCQRGEDR